MPPSICARMTSGLTAMPQSTAQTTRSTLTLPSCIDTSATWATNDLNDSCTAIPWARPPRIGLPQPAFSAARRSTPAARGLLSSRARRKASGSLPAAAASSSIIVSMTYAVCVLPTERHQSGRTASAGECSSPCSIGSAYALSATPSTEVGSMPSFTIISIGVPATIDWPTMTCFQSARRPAPSTDAFTECTYIGRYRPAPVSSSRVYCRRTGARPPIALATFTAATVKSDQLLARRPKLPPETSVCSLTLSIGRPAASAASLWSKVGNWWPLQVSSMAVVQPGDAVHRLHRRVGEERELVDRLDRLRGRRRGLARLGEGLARLRRLCLVAGQQLVAVETLARRFVPLHLERAPPLQRRPGAGGDDGDAFGDLDDVGDALHPLRLGRVERHQLRAEARRPGDHRRQQARQLDVDRVDRAAVALRRRVDARARLVLADVDELRRRLQRDVAAEPDAACRLGHLAVARALAGGMRQDALGGANLARRHLPLLGRGGDEHRPRRRAGVPVLQERIGDRRRPAGALEVAEHQVGVALRIRRRVLRAHHRPVGVELVGDQRGQAGRVALAHLVVLADDGDDAVAADADEVVRRERPGRGALGAEGHRRGGPGRVLPAPADEDDQAAGALQQGAPRETGRFAAGAGGGRGESGSEAFAIGAIELAKEVHGVVQATAAAAAWIAARIRW